jgi:hypothetical protein
MEIALLIRNIRINDRTMLPNSQMKREGTEAHVKGGKRRIGGKREGGRGGSVEIRMGSLSLIQYKESLYHTDSFVLFVLRTLQPSFNLIIPK